MRVRGGEIEVYYIGRNKVWVWLLGHDKIDTQPFLKVIKICFAALQKLSCQPRSCLSLSTASLASVVN